MYTQDIRGLGLCKKNVRRCNRGNWDICTKAGVYPRIIQREGGGEFSGDISNRMSTQNIDGVKLLSYSPQSNGLI